MIQLTPISIAATTQQYSVRIVERLCSAFCLTDDTQPQASVTYSVGNIKVVDGVAFVTVEANGSILYKPKGSCRTVPKIFNESLVVAFVGATTPTIALTQTGQIQAADDVKCCNSANAWSITSSLAITATF